MILSQIVGHPFSNLANNILVQKIILKQINAMTLSEMDQDNNRHDLLSAASLSPPCPVIWGRRYS